MGCAASKQTVVAIWSILQHASLLLDSQVHLVLVIQDLVQLLLLDHIQLLFKIASLMGAVLIRVHLSARLLSCIVGKLWCKTPNSSSKSCQSPLFLILNANSWKHLGQITLLYSFRRHVVQSIFVFLLSGFVPFEFVPLLRNFLLSNFFNYLVDILKGEIRTRAILSRMWSIQVLDV